MSNEELAITGGGLLLGASGAATISGAASGVVGSGIIAQGITSMVSAAPALGKVAVLAGSAVSSTVLAPVLLAGGVGLLLYACGKWLFT